MDGKEIEAEFICETDEDFEKSDTQKGNLESDLRMLLKKKQLTTQKDRNLENQKVTHCTLHFPQVYKAMDMLNFKIFKSYNTNSKSFKPEIIEKGKCT
jgi:hypothetical protein